MKALTQKSIKNTFLSVLLTKLFVLMKGLVRQLLFLEVKMPAYEFIKTILEEYESCKK